MPDLIVHRVIGERVLALLPPDTVREMDRSAWLAGLTGPDFWSCIRLPGQESRSRFLHAEDPSAFLSALTATGRADCLSYAAGYLCHLTLDGLVHPYMEQLLTTRAGLTHASMERCMDLHIAQSCRQSPRALMKPFPLPSHLLASTLGRVLCRIYGWTSCALQIRAGSMTLRMLTHAFLDRHGLLFRAGQALKRQRLTDLSYFHKDRLISGTDPMFDQLETLYQQAVQQSALRISALSGQGSEAQQHE